MRKLVCRHRRIQSAGGRDVLAEHLQMFHAHVLFTAPLSSGHVPQPGADQHQGRVAIREGSHHTGAAADLPVQPLNDIVGADASTVLAREIAVS